MMEKILYDQYQNVQLDLAVKCYAQAKSHYLFYV